MKKILFFSFFLVSLFIFSSNVYAYSMSDFESDDTLLINYAFDNLSSDISNFDSFIYFKGHSRSGSYYDLPFYVLIFYNSSSPLYFQLGSTNYVNFIDNDSGSYKDSKYLYFYRDCYYPQYTSIKNTTLYNSWLSFEIIYSTNNIYSDSSLSNLIFNKNSSFSRIDNIPVEPNIFNYTINYYFDDLIDNSKSFSSLVEEGSSVEYTNYSSEYYELDLSKPFDLVVDTDNKIINIYYKSKLYNYTINYYFDSELDLSKSTTGSNKYNSNIEFIDYSSESYKLIDDFDDILLLDFDNKTFNIFYESIKYNYTINYYFNGVLDNSKTFNGTGFYNSEIILNDYSNYFYVYDSNYSYDLILNEDNKVINVYLISSNNGSTDSDNDNNFLYNLAVDLVGSDIPSEFSFIYTIIEFIIAVVIVLAILSPFIIIIKIFKAVF